MAEKGETGKAVALLQDVNGKLVPNLDALQKLFTCKNLQGKEISIISICGAFRKGKSFILNFFLKFLKCEGWLSWLNHKDEKLGGFDWKGGCDACTEGILVWDEIFYRKINGREIAIILMDTQGLFDNETRSDNNNMIFAWSTLISSVQIFNLSQQVQENDLNYLQLFTEFARTYQSSGKEKPFEKLVFLIRDWQSPLQYHYGLGGGQKYLEERILVSKGKQQQLDGVRKHIKTSFNQTQCCLLPYPGEKVAVTESEKPFRGCLQDVSSKFLAQIDPFVRAILSPENLVVKTIAGRPMNAQSLLEYIKTCMDTIAEGNAPTPRNLVDITAQAQNQEVCGMCSDQYSSEMSKMKEDEKYVPSHTLEMEHEKQRTMALEKYKRKTRFGPNKIREKYKKRLEKQIDRGYKTQLQINEGKKIRREEELTKLSYDKKQEYHGKMKQEIGGVVVSSPKLNEIHDTIKEVVKKSFLNKANKNGDDTFTHEFNLALEKQIDSDFKFFKNNNDDQLRIAQEEDKQKKVLMKLRLSKQKTYEDAMKQATASFILEKKLSVLHKKKKQEAMLEYEVAACSLDDANIETGKIEEQKRCLEQNINAQYRTFVDDQQCKEGITKKSLELARNHMFHEYDACFLELLKDGYCKRPHLEAEHVKKINELINECSSKYNDDERTDPVFPEHERKARKALNSKYKDKFDINQEKRWLYKKIDHLFDDLEKARMKFETRVLILENDAF